MEINEQLNSVLMAAFAEAQKNRHEYLTPEHILYSSLFNSEGKKIIESTGGQVKKLIGKLEGYFTENMPKVESAEPIQSAQFKNVMERAIWHTTTAQKPELDLGDVIVAIFDEEDSFAAYFLKDEGITRYDLLNVISHGVSAYPEAEYRGPAEAPGEDRGETEEAAAGTKIIEAYTTELVQKAREGRIDPLIGREDILERTAQVLCRRIKNNPIHVGEAGVGKTATCPRPSGTAASSSWTWDRSSQEPVSGATSRSA
jgi:ATP-dependent Clp protease ATP-binding subunit ClpA